MFIAGGFHSSKVKHIEDCLTDRATICGIASHRQHVATAHRGQFRLRGVEHPTPVWLYHELVEPSLMDTSAVPHDQYEGCLQWILSDPRTAYLCERFYGVGGTHSVFNHTVQIEIACWNSLAILARTSPDRLVYMGIVHRLTKWVFGRCAEYLGIPTYFALRSPLDWRFWAVRGIDERQLVSFDPAPKTVDESTDISDCAKQYLEKITATYDIGMPSYMKGYVWSWKNEIMKTLPRNPLELPSRVHYLYRKYRLFDTYNDLVGSSEPSEPYVVFLLHYQPEATTLPSGYRYVQQWLAVRALSAAMPEHCQLMVKEHPSLFAKRLTERVRDVSFYEAVASLPRVSLVPMETDPFKLIDGSAAVATLTGTAGFEALCRDRPVLVFGHASYKECPGAYPVRSIEDIRQALQRILAGQGMPPREEFLRYLNWVERNSPEGVGASGKPDDRDARRNSKLKVWQALIGSGIEPEAISYDATANEPSVRDSDLSLQQG